MNTRHGGFSERLWRAAVLFCAGGLLLSCGVISVPHPKPEATAVPTEVDTGEVTVNITNDELQGFENIVVRVLGTEKVDTKKDDGILLLKSCGDGQYLSAWASGYYIKTVLCSSSQKEYNLTLDRYQVNDNTAYSWVEARNGGQLRSCEPCHTGATDIDHLEYTEWKLDGHANAFNDSHFWTTYLGTDVYRNASPPTQWTITDNSRRIRTRPDPARPYFGPGFKTDYPTDNGNCAFCHAPASVSGPQAEVDLSPFINSGQAGVVSEGVTCDVCHKVLNVRLGTDGMPFPDKPGVLSYDFIREDPAASRLYAGPLTATEPNGTVNDINKEIKVTCSPVYSESEFCAPCHYGQFWGTQVYNAYGEWKASDYSTPGNDNTYKTCQTCHMSPHNGMVEGSATLLTKDRKACSENKVVPEDFTHNMMQRGGDNSSNMIQDAAKIDLDAKKVDENIELTVRVTNVKAGHKFPTDSPLRHLILLVEVRDGSGTALPQIAGPTVPLWGGASGQPGDYAGQPGQIYANILIDTETNQAPTVAYWNPTRPAWPGSDTRLKPNETRVSKYAFAMPAQGSAYVTVKLIYRNAFIEIARQKGWAVNDLIVTQTDMSEIHP